MKIEAFLEAAKTRSVIDVRSPAEFAHGHVPGAQNVPLFDDEQRAEIGTLYKQTGREAAVVRGIDIAGPKFGDIVRQIKHIAGTECLLHCWRGGMRSNSVAWLLEQAEVKCDVLEGGYKSFRSHVLKSFERSLRLNVLSGLTGAGKTQLLPVIAEQGGQVIDLEGLASHRGSAFGGIGLSEQPSVEQFENMIFAQLSRLDPEKPIWVEDESRNVGKCVVPAGMFQQMRTARVVFLDVSVRRRAKFIAEVYGDMPRADLISAIERVTKRLGGLRTRQAVAAVSADDIESAITILLDYYDQSYSNAASSRDESQTVFVSVGDDESVESIASKAIAASKTQLSIV